MPPSKPPTKPPLSSLISTHDFAAAFPLAVPAKTVAFVTSAATDSLTCAANKEAYASITLRPRILRDVSGPIALSTTLLAHPVRSPIYAAPTSMGRTVHPEGEREIARGCVAAGVAIVVSTSASFAVREVLDVVGGRVPAFFQLYVDRDRHKSETVLREAVGAGVKGVWVTVDAPVIGKREADERAPLDEVEVTTPMSGAQAVRDAAGGGLGRIMGKYVDASLAWGDVAWLRGCLPRGMPVVLKGIQTAMDAVAAMGAGVEGIVVSNHGGRSLDTSPATILVLLELQRCCPQIFDRMEVFVDGGIMRGTDVFKALCLGAKGVGIGRGTLYGLGYGEEGVKKYIEILNDELETTMRMCGVTSLDELHPGLLNTRAVDHLIPSTVDEEHPFAKWRPSKL
ncbi:FMN-dependent dehydrogenase [Lasiosphaeris hirsuta]|uniref:FMN-dependent dehydrogenase n=1 Tax=Lasiosphaeris hirsuta TaxID=260670 RepID=A0AA40APU5_9PEZI|nr:FMN-dependent dehydrogenase [Lasiosphaeris hirsuta]